MKSLGNKEDVKKAREAGESGGRRFLKIPDSRTPWYLLDMEFVDLFCHWIELPNGRTLRVVCNGDPERDKGWAPEGCKVCGYVLTLYNEAKAVRSKGAEKRGDRIKDVANKMRANYEAHFYAVRGERVLIKDRKTGKKVEMADFDITDEDSAVEVGVISLTHAQYQGLTDLIEDENIRHVKSGDDLANRVLWTVKKQQGKRRYKEVVWNAETAKSDAPEVEMPEEITIEGDNEPDVELIDKVYALLTGESSEEVDEDEEVDVEEDSEEEPDDDYLDDVEDDEDEDETEEEYEEEEDEAEAEEDEEEEDNFEDDIPGEDEEEEPEPAAKKARGSKSGVRRAASGSKRSSGKADTTRTRRPSSTTSRSKSRSGAKAKTRTKAKATSSKGSSKAKSGKTRM